MAAETSWHSLFIYCSTPPIERNYVTVTQCILAYCSGDDDIFICHFLQGICLDRRLLMCLPVYC